MSETTAERILRHVGARFGCSPRTLRKLFRHEQRAAAEAELQRLIDAGQVIRSSHSFHVNGKPYLRLFTSLEASNAWRDSDAAERLKRPRTAAQTAQRETLKAKPAKAPKGPAHKTVALAADAPADYSRAKIIKTEPHPGRFEVIGPVPRITDSNDCRPWAMAATA